MTAAATLIRQRSYDASKAVFQRITDPVEQRILLARGLYADADLDFSLGRLPHPDGLSGMQQAVNILLPVVLEGLPTMVVADYDADGATACAVMVRGLRMLGAGQVSFCVPNRFAHGYGLTASLVQQIHDQGAPALLVTVDQGIASCDGVRLARQLGMQVLVTDHHLPPDELPEANAIVNPNMPGDDFPSKALAGVGVAFYVLLALRAALQQQGCFTAENRPQLASLLDLVALGTVADLVPLDAVNRCLVVQGMARLRQGKAKPGLQALAHIAGRPLAQMVTTDLGFALAPRLNAAGRLEDMSIGIRCLLSENTAEALTLATRLDELNQERRTLEAGMKKEALQAVAALQRVDGAGDGICVYEPHWHIGVIGIVAARVKDQVHKPVIAFARHEQSLKGSARSISGVHIRDVLALVDTQQPGLIQQFGGHAMAAGLSIASADYPRFCKAFNTVLHACMAGRDKQHVLWVDGRLDAASLSLEWAARLERLLPWGQKLETPLFEGEFRITRRQVMKEQHLRLQLHCLHTALVLEAVAFNRAEQPGLGEGQAVQAAYRLQVNRYRGRERLQLLLEHVAPVAA